MNICRTSTTCLIILSTLYYKEKYTKPKNLFPMVECDQQNPCLEVVGKKLYLQSDHCTGVEMEISTQSFVTWIHL
jgi:hypothetical protein